LVKNINKSMGRPRRSLEEFISKCISVHGLKYDYSLVDYVNSNTRIKIICKVHGEFEQFPFIHMKGAKCPKCANEDKKLSTVDFIEKANKIHAFKYTYDNTLYVSSKEDVLIRCNIHGDFLQTPNTHLDGHGCPKCKSTLTGDLTRKTTDDFVLNSIRVHGNLYDYSKVQYINNKKKVAIICKDHGEFYQTPNCHLKGNKCPHCKKSKKKTINEILELFKNIHGEKYDYSNVIYKNMNTKVIIECPLHGKFAQTPATHINQRHGCPICRMSHGELKIYRYLTERSVEFKPQYGKLGIKHIGTLKFDFAVRINGRIGVIEYNGVQHYKEVEGFKDFEGIQIRDSIKRIQCSNRKIPLLVIAYSDFNHIETKLEEFLDSPAFNDAPRVEPLDTGSNK